MELCESVMGADESVRASAQMLALGKQANTFCVDTAFTVSARMRLALDQRAAA